ncbi:MAG: AmmeMemoRadiSam system protein B [Proteobacteria bacterium]|nr:AmmeMemoRadiSam system protein B [Pseudomonadota bacterium]MBU4472304.1 AmmeMemoRadiSam system protein B [Pseudomonadota bacterium]MCG2752000.1 AmmeMemoRadiSam system protein B [Desulfobacteraceae bacterium]
MTVRKAILAGSWYPATAAECRSQIEDFIQEHSNDFSGESRSYMAGVVPHAGWYFSGSIACNVIKNLAAGPQPDVVVLFGMHLHSGSSNYIMKEGFWETPLGEIEIHSELAHELEKKFPFVVETPRRFVQDNTIEVQLPFIKHFMKDVKIVPMGVPPTLASLDLAAFVAKKSKEMGLSIKIIGSTDLTHYGDNYGFQPKGSGPEALEWVKKENDARLIEKIMTMDPEGILKEAREHQNACCSGAVASAVKASMELGADTAYKLAYATSYDKNPGDSFVGYAGVLFS